MSEVKPVAAVETLARYEPDIRYIGTGEYVAECVHADGGDYYLAADVDAAVEALRVDVMGLTARAERAEARVAELEALLNLARETLQRIAAIAPGNPTLNMSAKPGDKNAVGYGYQHLARQASAAIDQQLAATQGGEA